MRAVASTKKAFYVVRDCRLQLLLVLSFPQLLRSSNPGLNSVGRLAFRWLARCLVLGPYPVVQGFRRYRSDGNGQLVGMQP